MLEFTLHQILFIILLKQLTLCEDIIENFVSLQTNSGPLNGFTDNFNGKQVDVFLGIPYAEPPVGDHRFRKPDPVKTWTQPLNVNQWPNNCYQIKNNLIDYKSSVFSEDCLYLNIWSPNTEPGAHTKRRPVIFFIHPGEFSMDSSTNANYDGKVLSALGDVIVVTMNYRLGAFGFLYADFDDVPGNMGLWDQLMALQWVNHNIEYFGGDPKSITLMGFATGASCVTLHQISPHSRYLFKNAIFVSGAAYSHVTDRTAQYMRKLWFKAVQRIGCAEDQEYSYPDFNREVIECLRKTSAENLILMANEIELSYPALAWDRLVVIDGDFLPDHPIDILSSEYLNSSKNILIGTAEDEGSIFLHHFKGPSDFRLSSNLKEAGDELYYIAIQFQSNLKIYGEELSQFYFYAQNESTDPLELRSRIGRAVGDFYMSCPAIRFTELLFFENPEFVNAYQYSSTYSYPNPVCPWSRKANHFTDALMVFGIPFLSPDSSEQQKDISKQMIEMFSHFARFGFVFKITVYPRF